MRDAETQVTVEYVQGDNRSQQILRFSIAPEVVFQGGRWLPGVLVQEDPVPPDWIEIPEDAGMEADPAFHAELIAYALNEGAATSGEIIFFEEYPEISDLILRWERKSSVYL